MAPRVAWIGLGNMGNAMAKNVIEKVDLDDTIVLFNRTTSQAERLREEVGATRAVVATSIAAAVAAAELIFTCLGNDEALKETMEQALETDISGKIFVDCSTVDPDLANEIASKVGTRGAGFASMPVLGSPGVASSGQLLCILAGPSKVLDLVTTYTKGVVGREVIVFRDELPGKSQLLKLIANMFILNVNEVVAEGLTFAEKASVEPRKLQELLSLLFGGPYTVYSERMVSGAYKKGAQVPVEMALKDARHALKIAGEVECVVPSLELAKQSLEVVERDGGPKADSSGVYEVWRERRSGLHFKD